MIEIRCVKELRTAQGPMRLCVDMQVREGDFVSLFGESGSGKTTILRMVAGLLRPDEGYIRIGKTVLFDSAAGIDIPPQHRRTTLVFQEHNLFPNMTVWENIAYALRSDNDRAFAQQLMQAVDMSGLRDVRPLQLSGGQRQRVACVRALANRPDVLLLDEPFSSLDAQMRARLQDEVAALYRRFGMTVLFVSHDVAEVMRLSTYVVCLSHGAITARGTPEEVFVRQRLSSKFKVSGTVLAKAHDGVLTVVTVAVGSETVRVAADDAEAAALSVGDTVVVASKAFNPVIMKAVVP